MEVVDTDIVAQLSAIRQEVEQSQQLSVEAAVQLVRAERVHSAGEVMTLQHQVWMLQRVADVLRECTGSTDGRAAVGSLLEPFDGGSELLELDSLLEGSRVRKVGGRLYSVA